MNQALVSIIVPVYNDQNYIKRCIDSVLNQTFKNFELLLIVDGANDNSENICRQYASKDNRIRVYIKQNGGTADTRNYGLDKSEGKYIAFLDTDDYVADTYLEVLYKGISEYDADIAAVKYVEKDEGKTNFISKKEEGYSIFDNHEGMRNIFHDEIYGNFVWNKMYKKEMFNDIKFVKVPKIEDMATMYLIFDKAKKTVFNSSELYFYVQRLSSQLHKREFKIFTNKLLVIRERYYYLLPKYPNIEENYKEYAQAIVECYPFNLKNKELIQNIRKDFKTLYPRVKNALNKKEKLKAFMYGLI